MKNYTITEAMPILGVGRTTITYWINIGIVDAKKVSGKWLIKEKSIQEWLDFQKAGLPAASEEFRKRFELATENFQAMQQARHAKTLQ